MASAGIMCVFHIAAIATDSQEDFSKIFLIGAMGAAVCFIAIIIWDSLRRRKKMRRFGVDQFSRSTVTFKELVSELRKMEHQKKRRTAVETKIRMASQRDATNPDQLR